MKRVAITVGIIGMIILLLFVMKIVFNPRDQLTVSPLLFILALFSKLTKYVLDYMDK